MRDLLRAAARGYYGGERARGGAFDSMPYVGLALGLVRDGAGDDNRPDVAGAIARIDAYVERLRQARAAIVRLAEGVDGAVDPGDVPDLDVQDDA